MHNTSYLFESISKLLSQGVALYAQGSLDMAIKHFQQAINLMGKLRALLEPKQQWTPELRNDLANLHMNYGVALYAQGQLNAAIDRYQQAIDLKVELQKLLEPEQQWTPELRNDLAIVYMNQGNAFLAQGQLVAAMNCYKQAIDLMEKLRVLSKPEDQWILKLRNDLAAAYMNSGHAFFAQGQLNTAIDCHQRAISLREELRALLEPKQQWTPELRNYLAKAYVNHGVVLHMQSQLNAAIERYQQAINLMEEMRALLEPKQQWTLELRNALANIYTNQGTALRAQGQLDAAIERYQQAINLMEELRALLEPKQQWTLELRNDLANTYMNQGIVLHEQGQFNVAIKRFQQAIDLMEEMRELLNTEQQWTLKLRSDLANSYMNHGVALYAQRQFDAAIKRFQQAINLMEKLRELLDPEQQWTPELRNDLARVYVNLGNAFDKQGQLGGAINCYKHAIDLMEELRELLDPEQQWTIELPSGLAIAYSNLGGTLYAQGQLVAATASFHQAIIHIETIEPNILPEADVTRFKLYFNAVRLLFNIPNPHDFAHKKSRRMVELLEFTLWGEEEWDYRLQLRQHFTEFHAQWLNYCVNRGETQVIPEILSIIQGREIAAEILDKLHLEQDATPEISKKFHALRLELRKIAARIQGVIKGHGGGNGSDGIGPMDSRMLNSMSDLPKFPRTLPEEYHQLEQQHAALLIQLRTQRELVVKEPGYEVLNPIVTTEALQAKLRPNEAILLAIDRPHVTLGVLIIRNSGQPHWQEVPQIEAIADDVRYVSDGNSHSRGYRAGSVAATTDAAHLVGINLTNFWDAIKKWLTEHLWQKLATELDRIAHLTIILHGRLHMLPIESGAPTHLTTIRMPGLVFFAQRRGIIGKHIDPPTANVALSIDVHPGDQNMKQIPYVQAEQSALQQLYSDKHKQVIAPGNFPKLAQCVEVVHIGSHGGEDAQQPGAALLHLEQRKVNQHAILDAKPSLQYVYINACIAARTVEDLNGTPSGLTSALFRSGVLQMVGALIAIPDKWAFLLAVLTHQAMLRGNITLGAALREGKRRLATGDWFEDTETLLQNTSHQYIRAFQRAKRLPKQQQELQNFCTQLGWSSQEQTELGNKLASLRGEDWINAAANALASELFTSRIPPQPDLGTLLYGVVLFG